MKKNNRTQGFSLVELMIVIAIGAFLMMCTIASVRFFDRSFVRSELYFLKLFCQRVRSDAITCGDMRTIQIDPGANSYSAHGMTVQLPAQVCFGAVAGALGPPSLPAQSIVQSVTFKDNNIICHTDGSVSSGIVYMTDKDHSVSYALSNGVGASSYLRLYRYEGSKWVMIE
jgi:prepilin-type N-terminal cleavage/methylation domain-containing protein